jgi:hypothetical protein
MSIHLKMKYNVENKNNLDLTFTWCWRTMLINIQNNIMPYKSQSFDEIERLWSMPC